MTVLGAGDIIAVRSTGLGPWLIRLGERLHRIDDVDDHIAVMHHYDTTGVPWALEGRPGGVGWVDARNYLADKWTVTNAEQPKTAAQRLFVATNAEHMLRCGYDWPGIAGDACIDLGFPELWPLDWHGTGSPGHVVCSSFAAWLYDHAPGHLAHPEPSVNDRWYQPGDWSGWMKRKDWAARQTGAAA